MFLPSTARFCCASLIFPQPESRFSVMAEASSFASSITFPKSLTLALKVAEILLRLAVMSCINLLTSSFCTAIALSTSASFSIDLVEVSTTFSARLLTSSSRRAIRAKILSALCSITATCFFSELPILPVFSEIRSQISKNSFS